MSLPWPCCEGLDTARCFWPFPFGCRSSSWSSDPELLSSSSSSELGALTAGAAVGAPSRAIAADPATNSGWLVLMYAA